MKTIKLYHTCNRNNNKFEIKQDFIYCLNNICRKKEKRDKEGKKKKLEFLHMI